MAATGGPGAVAADFPVNDEGWPLAPEGYEILDEVGQGAFAKVMKARCPSKGPGVNVAIKVMSLENITTSLEEIQAEVKTMKLSRHENVLDLFCCFVVRSSLWLVTPLMDKGSCYYCLRTLRKLHHWSDGQGLPEDVIATILKETLQGLDYIHGHGQIHRDVKAGNILLNSEGRVALADFGVAGWLTDPAAAGTGMAALAAAGAGGGAAPAATPGAGGAAACRTFVGTPCWMAPEVMEQHAKGYNEKADIWSLGITALELAKGYAPYARFPPMQVLIKTIKEPPPSLRVYEDERANPRGPGSGFSDRFHKFVARCLQKDPSERPSAHELLSDPFIKRTARPGKLPELLLAFIPEVGSPEAARLDGGAAPAGGKGPIETLPGASADLVKGTTWVFPDDLRARVMAAAPAVGGEGIDGGAGGLPVGGAAAGLPPAAAVGGGGGAAEDSNPLSAAEAEELLNDAIEGLGGEGGYDDGSQ